MMDGLFWNKIGFTHRHWKMPSGPRPKWGPRTGKNRSKKVEGHPNSENSKTMTWNTIKRRLTTAQKTPAAWLGTVLPLSESRSAQAVDKRREKTRTRCSHNP